MTDEKQSPAQAEVTGQPLKFEWAGETFDLPASTDEWDIDVIRAEEAGNFFRSIELAFGPDFPRLEKAHRAAHGGRFTIGQAEELTREFFGAYGIDLGNL